MPGEATHNVEEIVRTQCCIVGGGPAGMMLALLLARAGVDVVVLEKHADFLRDFRGDTIHPSTLQLLHELGMLDEFLERPHHKVRQARGNFEDDEVVVADFSRLSVRCPYIALMPQWDFLDFLSTHAGRYGGFHLRMQAEVIGLIEEQGRIVGVRARTTEGELQVRAPLTVGADGRHSVVRAAAGQTVDDLAVPIDVLWMRISKRPNDPEQLVGRFRAGRALVMIDRGDYWQCGFLIRKGDFDRVRQQGLPAFREQLASVAPLLTDRLGELDDWNQIKLLTVRVDRLRTWYREGLLCIGDAAHAMSPVGGVGINLAIQDAVAAANQLARPLREGAVELADLRRIQRRRMLPTRVTQGIQVQVHNRFLTRVLGDRGGKLPLPWPLKLLRRFPRLRRLPARLIGIGVRPEHVRTPAVAAPPAAT